MRRLYALLIIITLSFVPCISSLNSNQGLQSSPWPMFQHDERHTGRSEYDTSNNTGKEIWRFKTEGWVDSSPAIDKDGVIYAGSGGGYLYAIYPNGTLKWKIKLGGWVDSSPAIAEDGTIYIGSTNKCLYAVSPNGTLKWKYKTGGDIKSSPVIGKDGTVYIGSVDGYFYAFYPNGTLKWKYKTGGDIPSSPAIAEDGTIYVGSWFGNEKEHDWGYIHAIKDGMDKGIEIIRPREDYLYIFDREIMKNGYTTVIGKITVQVAIVSEEHVEKVEFYYYYKYRYTDYSPPFEWKWNERIYDPKQIFKQCQVSAKAYYDDGDVVGSEMFDFRMFNPFGR